MPQWLILVAIALAISALGFKKFIWFVSIGYAFSVLGLAAGMASLFWKELTLPVAAALLVMAAYALRLGLFLAIREARGGTYKKVLEEATAGARRVPLALSLIVWAGVGFLYFAQVSPLYFRLSNGLAGRDQGLLLAGTALSAFGLALQAVADAEKSAAKKRAPGRFCSTGLYAVVRCPNYLGEILVWVGLFIGSMSCLYGPLQWSISLLGLGAIVFIMFNGARRLEKRQTESYGADPAFRAYCGKVPIIIPLIPLYSLRNWKFLG